MKIYSAKLRSTAIWSKISKHIFVFLEPCFLTLSTWSKWGACAKINEEKYFQTRTRSCSRLSGCNGVLSERRHCAPQGIIWGDWSKCSCFYKVQHRLPLFIAGCVDCPQLQEAQYQRCTPQNCVVPSMFIILSLYHL